MNDKTQPENGRLLIVSNRLSVRVERRGKSYEYHPSVGGLATSLSSLSYPGEIVWAGWPGIYIPEAGEQASIKTRLREDFKAIPVFLSQRQVEQYYDGFSNRAIWPLFHYFPQHTHYNPVEWQAYQDVNRLFRDKILEVMQPGDRVWVHDYHLMLLPALIREAAPAALIGFFLHIPFPSYEIYRMLPWREQILQGLLGADLIGFHSFGYTRHFFSSLLRLLGLEQEFGQLGVGGRPVRVDTFPLGVDVDRFVAAAQEPAVHDQVVELRQKTEGHKIVLSVDRLDFTKGIRKRLQAYETFLERYPHWQGRVILIALCVPSRIRVPEYQSLKREVDELVGRINGRFGQPGWTPVWYLYRSFPFQRLVSLYRLADVALVTPLRDGMNLVAKEYLAARPDGTGVLILSETAGAAEELGEALIINPYDEQGMVAALLQALEMPVEEQQVLNQPMLVRLRRYNTAHWADDFLGKLDAAAQLRQSLKQERLTAQRRAELLQHYQASQRRLLFLDYDGTLVPFARRPSEAVPDRAVLNSLKALTGDPRNTVVIISGRDHHTLATWLGEVRANLVAEHGARVRLAGETTWRKMGASLSDEWKQQLRPLLEVYADRTPGAILEDKEDSLAWHYRNADPEISSLRAKELISTLENFVANTSLSLLHGHKVIEVKSSNVSKGTAAQQWLSRPGYDFILALGDDVTDEYLFEVMPADGWSIKVGQVESSKARFYISGPVEVRQLLMEFSGG